MAEKKFYPLGIQHFPTIREEGYFYVDKTELIYRLSRSKLKYVFLSRPRRFGKSLLTSTLKCYFEGRKELFKGLAIETLETEWDSYPVLHFDFSVSKSTDITVTKSMINLQLNAYEQMYGGRPENEEKFSDRLKGLIERAYRQEQKPVVVLIDEYDSPMLSVLHDEEKLDAFRELMQNFYSPLKGCGQYIRFCFLTGITKFSQLSIFSALNNIVNISMDAEYAAICGITREELETQMASDIETLAERMELTCEETLGRLVEYYDGYHFAGESPDIFNPFSLLCAFAKRKIKPYWFETGTPTALIKLLRKSKNAIVTVEAVSAQEQDFDRPTERMSNDPTALLYQSGYLTIKGYSRISGVYRLDIPNKEVRMGLSECLLGEYVKLPRQLNTLAGEMSERVYYDDIDGALRLMQTAFDELPYCTRAKSEGHFQ